MLDSFHLIYIMIIIFPLH